MHPRRGRRRRHQRQAPGGRAVLREELPQRDAKVARLAGEEFGVVLARTNHQAAAAIGKRLGQAVADAGIHHTVPVNGRGLTISLSLASWAPHSGAALELDRLLQRADDLLDAGEGQGRDRVVAAAFSAADSEGERLAELS